MTMLETTDRTVSSLAVPLSMVHGPGSFCLRLTNAAPGWQMAKGDYLIVKPPPRGERTVGTCRVGAYVVIEHQGTFLRYVHHNDGYAIMLKREDGAPSLYTPPYPFICLGVLAGVIRKY